MTILLDLTFTPDPLCTEKKNQNYNRLQENKI